MIIELVSIHTNAADAANAANDALHLMVEMALKAAETLRGRGADSDAVMATLAGLVTGIEVLAEHLYGEEQASALVKALEDLIFEPEEPSSVG